MPQATYSFGFNSPLLFFVLFLTLASCKKDCLEKGKCEPNSYNSTYLVEQSTPPASGITYYIDSENGAEGNNGLSPETAFQAMEQLEGVSFNPGDQILFKRGQYHFGEMILKSSGTEEERIYIADYGEGAMPLIKTRDKKDGIAIQLSESDYVTIQNLNIQGGGIAILLDGSNHTIVEGCRIGEESESGLRATGRHSETSGSNNGIVRHCLIYSGLEGALGDLQGTDGIQLMDGASDWHIYENEFKAWAHSAMSIKAIYTDLSSNNNLVEMNLFDCSDIDYMRAFDMTGAENRASNNVFQRNIVKNQTVTSHLHGNDNTAAYNLFVGLKPSSATEQPWAIDFHVFIGNSGGVDRNEYVCFNNKVYNNVFYNYQNGVGVRLLKSKDGTTHFVHDNEIINNVFFEVGTPIESDSEPAGTKISNNLFYSASSYSFVHNSTTYDLSGFTALNGSNGFVIEDNLEGNPLFVNPSTTNFSLMSGSTAIDAGISVGLLTDFNGTPLSGDPDIGAFEF